MTRILALCTISLLMAATPVVFSAPTVVEADPALSVEVEVNGEDRSGGGFSILILPADYPQPVRLEEVEQFVRRTSNGRLVMDELAPGKYLVAVILPPSTLQEEAPTHVAVEAPEWVRNSSSVTRGFWPAFEVDVGDDTQELNVRFERKPYPPLAEQFSIPHTNADTFTPTSDSRFADVLRIAGFAAMLLGALSGIVALRSSRLDPNSLS